MIFVLDSIRSKYNIWSIFRTCDAFWIKKLILTWFCAHPPDKEISKTAIWAENYVKWQYYQNINDAIDHYKKEWKKIISIEINENAKNIKNVKFTWNEVFIFWNEITWVSTEALSKSDEIIKIPIKWKIKESLNVWVSAWIIWAFLH